MIISWEREAGKYALRGRMRRAACRLRPPARRPLHSRTRRPPHTVMRNGHTESYARLLRAETPCDEHSDAGDVAHVHARYSSAERRTLRALREREVGRGGMAIVYLAGDSRHERKVAITFLDPELGAVLGAERFLSEIRVTANLQHPNLRPSSTRSISHWDVTNDDDRLIVIHHRDGLQRAQLVVVENAFQELRARVPR